MKALILNSGLGSRMGDLTRESCKCLVELGGGVTIFDLQVQALQACGVSEICVTSGAFSDALEAYAKERYGGFEFVHNPLYAETNYIYSIYLAREALRGHDIILMHGDLVFEQNVLQDVIAAARSVMVTDVRQPLPEKDFKAVVRDGRIARVSVDSFEGSRYAQPLYKLLRKDWDAWLDGIVRFCEGGQTKVYAEEALPVGLIEPFEINGRVCMEVDNSDDLARAREFYLQMPERRQKVYAGCGAARRLAEIVRGARKPLVVYDPGVRHMLPEMPGGAEYFVGFTPNPNYADVMEGIKLFEREGCDFIVSVGGGSAIDVAKSINILEAGSPRAEHLAVPTTAGSGSESTCFAVLYKDGKKMSVEHAGVLPDYAILDSEFLESLPVYHKKSSLFDALCQGVESLWAKGRSGQSEAYARSVISAVYADIDDYLAGDSGAALRMMQAANLSGKAINIGKTTAAHAMSYKLSAMYGLAHGHAAALCLVPVWRHLAVEQEYFARFAQLLDRHGMFFDFKGVRQDEIDILVASVDSQRLGNHPAELSESDIRGLYMGVFGK